MKSIALRLWVYIIILILIILSALWFFQTGLLNNFYVSREIDSIKREARSLSSLKSVQDINKLSQEIESISKAYNATVDIIDSQGRIVVSTGGMMRGRIANIEAAEFPKVISGLESEVRESHAMSGLQLVSIGIPLRHNNIIIGVVFVHMPISSIKDALDILKSQFFLVIIIAVIIATLAAFILSKRFTGPILKINNAALQISKGEFNARVDISYKDEIGRLGDTINHMASELSKVESLRKDLIANISHEFRTPLGIIKSYGEGLMDEVYLNDKEKREYINIILDETSRLSLLVNDVLDISKLQSGNMKMEKAPFNIGSLIKRVYDKFKVMCNDKGVNITAQCADSIMVSGDEARIEQVMINLLNNSLNHAVTNGKIDIKMTDKDDTIVIEVIDTGKGIPKEDLPYIFDRFYKADKTGQKSSAGTGLGLAIVKEILNGHSSNYGVESEVGRGTRFYFTLNKVESQV